MSKLEERSCWAAFLGSSQAVSLRDHFLCPRFGQGPQKRDGMRRRAFAKCSWGDHCHGPKPAKESSSREATALPSLVFHSQIQADSNDNKPQSHFYYILMKLMLKNKLQLNSQIPYINVCWTNVQDSCKKFSSYWGGPAPSGHPFRPPPETHMPAPAKRKDSHPGHYSSNTHLDYFF